MKLPLYKGVDLSLILAACLQILLGCLVIQSASQPLSENLFADELFFFKRHIVLLGVSTAIAFFIAKYWPVYSNKLRGSWFAVASILLLVIPQVPGIGLTINGANRYIQAGLFNFSSEALTILMAILFVSDCMTRTIQVMTFRSTRNLKLLGFLFLVSLLFLLQPNVPAMFVMLLVASGLMLENKHYSNLGVLLTFLILAAGFTALDSPYRMLRLLAYFHPFENRLDSGYQITLGLMSIAGGKWTGVGFHNGALKTVLPEVHTNYIFASLVEEQGMLVGIVAMSISCFIYWRSLIIAVDLRKLGMNFESMIVKGLALWMILYALLNVASVLNWLPPSHLPFPFLSYGPSYTLIFILNIALILSFGSRTYLNSNANSFEDVAAAAESQRKDLSLAFNQLSKAMLGSILLITLFLSMVLIKIGAFDAQIAEEYRSTVAQLTRKSEAQQLSEYERGDRARIVDRNGSVLAKNIAMADIWVDPRQIDAESAGLKTVMALLFLPKSETLEKLARYRDSQKAFAYLKRGVDKDTGLIIAGLKIEGLHVEPVNRRFYPMGEASAALLGLTSISGEGLSGVELSYNEALSGESQRNTLPLSIDSRIQHAAYQQLKKSVEKSKAKRGSAVVVSAQTGEILAMTSYPSFDPNDRREQDVSTLKNLPASTLIQPGNLVAPITIAAALSSGSYTMDSIVDTRPGALPIRRFDKDRNHDYVIQDPIVYGDISVAKILEKGSQVGLAKITLQTSKKVLYDMFHDLGYGQRSGAELSEEQVNFLEGVENSTEIQQVEIALGQGFLLTPLQIVRSYIPIFNGGKMHPLTLLKRSKPLLEPATVFSEELALDLKSRLNRIIAFKDSNQNVSRVEIAGRSALIPKAISAFQQERFLGASLGAVELEKEKLLVFTVIDEPEDQYSAKDQSDSLLIALVQELSKIGFIIN